MGLKEKLFFANKLEHLDFLYIKLPINRPGGHYVILSIIRPGGQCLALQAAKHVNAALDANAAAKLCPLAFHITIKWLCTERSCYG